MVRALYSGAHAESSGRHGKNILSVQYQVLRWNRVSCTLPKSVIAETGIIHPDRERYLSISEAKRIGSFPDQFQLQGKYREQWARIGNSVPPLFMRAIAEHIRAHILEPTLHEAAP
jgi:site-specific DNA-cytosine methylase